MFPPDGQIPAGLYRRPPTPATESPPICRRRADPGHGLTRPRTCLVSERFRRSRRNPSARLARQPKMA